MQTATRKPLPGVPLLRSDAPANILIVDDDPKNLTVLEAILDDPGYRVVRAESAEQALLALLVDEFALAILDIRMPGMTGFELADTMKTREKSANVPIIFLTAYYNEAEYSARSYEMGAVDYLSKPVDAAALRSKAAVFAELYRERSDLGQINRTLAALVQSSDDGIISSDLDGTIATFNPGAEQLFGYKAEEAVGQPITILTPPDRQHEAMENLARVRDGKSITHYETIRRRKDGTPVEISLTMSPVKDHHGKIVGASKIARDITEQKGREEHIRFLLRELNHRAKNMLSVVEVIAHRTASKDREDFIKRFSDRIHALSAGQELLIRNEWQGVDLGDLVRAQLAAFTDFVGSRIAADGPKLRLKPAAAQPIGLALHELATNASKYGALSTDNGRVDITWRTNGDSFALTWTEHDGPPVSAPQRRGFGTIVLKDMAEHSVDGRVDLDYAPSGVTWRLTCPIANALEPGDVN